MRPKWAFQLLPNTQGILGKGFRVDEITQAVEDEVNSVLQCKFNFHDISKLVIILGPKEGEKDYHEHTGVAQKYYPDFDIYSYKDLNKKEKQEVIKNIIKNVFEWLLANFDDAQCFEKAQKDLGWL